MSEIKNNWLVFLLWSTLAGTISFFISAGIIEILLFPLDFAIIDTILVGGIGGLLLGIFLIKRHKIRKITLAGLISVPIGFWGAFILTGSVDLLFPLFGVNSEDPNIYGIMNIIGITFQGLICGAIFGGIIYGRKSIWVFSVVCGMVSLPFGILVGLFNSGHPIKSTFENLLSAFGILDLNLLAIIMSFGIGLGLSIGIYNKLKLK